MVRCSSTNLAASKIFSFFFSKNLFLTSCSKYFRLIFKSSIFLFMSKNNFALTTTLVSPSSKLISCTLYRLSVIPFMVLSISLSFILINLVCDSNSFSRFSILLFVGSRHYNQIYELTLFT